MSSYYLRQTAVASGSPGRGRTTRPILLDTCAALWLSDPALLDKSARRALDEAESVAGSVMLSPITAWEIGILVSQRRLFLSMEPAEWFQALLDAGLALAPLSPRILVASSFLPGWALRDPADRILAATARAQNYRLMTRDQKLLDYAAEGHLQAIAC